MKCNLLYSSIGMSIHTLPFIIITNNLLIKRITILGIITSILNHGTNWVIFKYIDRTVMVSCAIIDAFIIYDFYNFYNHFLLILSINLYFIAKITKNDFYHMLCHYFIIILHNNLML